jgi:hypothetical protein
VIVNDWVEGQPPFVAVTVIVAVIGLAVLLIGVNAGIADPVPLANRPIDVLSFAQLNVVPEVALEKVKGPELCPAQTIILAGTVKPGAGSIPNVRVAVVVPHSLVTAKVIEFVAAELNVICPGSALVDVAGVPPENVHR